MTFDRPLENLDQVPKKAFVVDENGSVVLMSEVYIITIIRKTRQLASGAVLLFLQTFGMIQYYINRHLFCRIFNENSIATIKQLL
jgi:hypothetical protein